MRTVFLLVVAAIWGWTFTLVKQGMGEVGPFWFLSLRFSLATGLAALLLAGRLGGRRAEDWARGGVLGLALFGGYFFQTWGLVYTTAQKSGLITGLSVVLVPVLARLVGQATGRRMWLATLLAAAGLALLVMGGREPLGPTGLGDLLTLACAVCFAAHIVLLDRYTKAGDFLTLLPAQLAVVAVLSLIGTFLWEQPDLALSAATWRAIVITGALATALAFFLLSWIQRRSTAAYTAVVLSAEPAFAVLLGWITLGEALRGAQILGAVLILAGIVLPQLRRRRGQLAGQP
ncbi:MAG: DMT family transporter [Candidatus Bipolaricaulaceae bacterium]